MQVFVFEDAGYRDLLPLTYSRAAFELRCGIDSLFDKIVAAMGTPATPLIARSELADLVAGRTSSPRTVAASDTCYWINGRFLLHARLALPCPSACWSDRTLIAAHLPAASVNRMTATALGDFEKTHAILSGVPSTPLPESAGALIQYPWDLIAANADELTRQIAALPGRRAGGVDAGAHLLNPGAIAVGEGSRIKPMAVLDAESGPIHVGRDVLISPGAVIRGPCSIGDGSLVHSGAYIREGTTIGPMCKVGGEIEGTIFQGYANKQHDGFVGHSYVGEWVNLGADTVTSDLKNTYGNIAVPLHGTPVDTGLRFVGSIIGDHSKTGICTALATGTVIGFCSNIVVPRPPQYVPSFTWLTERGPARFELEKAIAIARTVMGRRKVEMTKPMESQFRSVFASAASEAMIR